MAEIKDMLLNLAAKVLEQESGDNTPAKEAPVVETVETESLKTKASSGCL